MIEQLKEKTKVQARSDVASRSFRILVKPR